MRGDFEKVNFEEFISLSKYIQEENAEKIKQGYIYASYTAFQLGAGGEKKSFGGYLQSLGLGEKKEKLTPVQKKKMVSKGINAARKILRMKARKKTK